MSYAHKNQILPVRNVLIPVTHDTHLFNFDYHAMSGRGLEPKEGSVYTLRPDGKFGGAIAVEESTENIINPDPLAWTRNNAVITHLGGNRMKINPTTPESNTSRAMSPSFPVEEGEELTLSFTLIEAVGESRIVFRRGSGYRAQTNLHELEPGRHSVTTTVNSGWTTSSIWVNVFNTFGDNDGSQYAIIEDVMVERKGFATSFTQDSRPTGRVLIDGSYIPRTEGSINIWSYIHPINLSPQNWRHLWDSTGPRFALVWSGANNRIEVRRNGTTILTPSKPTEFDEAEWHMYTVTWGPSLTELYIDGVLWQRSTAARPPLEHNDFVLGARHTGSGYEGGLFDEFAIFNRVLSPEEIMAIYESQSPLYDPYDLSATIG